MKVEIFAGCGTLRELRWKGNLDLLPSVDNVIDLPKSNQGYRVDRIDFRLDRTPPTVEIYVK